MKPSFHVRAYNSPFEDPGLFVRLLREKRALMFDLGSTVNLFPRDILKTTDIFVSHTHVDHFTGFDNILRTSLKKEGPLRLYGPEGFISHVEAKLGSYTWNIIQDYPLKIEASEITEGYVRTAVFKAENSFVRQDAGSVNFDGFILKDSFFNVKTEILDHQVPCLAFSLEEDYHININKAKLSAMNLPVGNWLKDLKTAIRKNKHESTYTINGDTFTFSELRDVADITRGQKVSYVVDVLGSNENIKKIVELVKNSDILYIEAYFLDQDRDRAKDRFHLTAKEAGMIAREAGVGRLESMHISPRYINNHEMILQEAEKEFKR